MALPPASDAIPAWVEEIETPHDLFLGLGDGEVLLECAALSEARMTLRT